MNMLDEYDIAETSYKAGSDFVAETSGAAVANADVIPGKAVPTSRSLSDNQVMTEPNLPARQAAVWLEMEWLP
jgi:hypothetical protein